MCGCVGLRVDVWRCGSVVCVGEDVDVGGSIGMGVWVGVWMCGCGCWF